MQEKALDKYYSFTLTTPFKQNGFFNMHEVEATLKLQGYDDTVLGISLIGYNKEDVTDNYFGTVINDPYRWLENPNSTETKEWIENQNKITDN